MPDVRFRSSGRPVLPIAGSICLLESRPILVQTDHHIRSMDGPCDTRTVHTRTAARAQIALLLRAPSPHDVEARRDQPDELVDAREQPPIIAGQRGADMASPPAISILVSLQYIDRVAQRGFESRHQRPVSGRRHESAGGQRAVSSSLSIRRPSRSTISKRQP